MISDLRQRAIQFFERLQVNLTEAFEVADGKAHFHEDAWTYADGGGGKTRVMQDGALFEKAGVNFSAISGTFSDLLAVKLNVEEKKFFATGISVVIHPFNPMVPTVHMNLRYIELANGDAWFGGGADLTPYYLFEEDVRHFHSTLKAICDKHNQHNQHLYMRFKKWCDEYFFIKHRGETRGVGGIFFDYIRENLEQFFLFVRDLGNGFLDAYLPIVERRRTQSFTEHEKKWQLIRRGRYVEFNLIYDRGTLFGLETQGRTESILMSLPPMVRWDYNPEVMAGSAEAALLEVLHRPREWVTADQPTVDSSLPHNSDRI